MSKKTKPAAPKATRELQPVKNGMRHPREGGKTADVWQVCDALTKALKRTPTRAEVLKAAAKNAKPNMVATQYGYWRRFHGIKGRVNLPKPAAAKKPAKPAKPSAKPAKKPAPPKAAAKPAAPAKPTPPVAQTAPLAS